MSQKIVITLEPDEAQALIRCARKEVRHPREQAHFILRKELENQGLLEAVVQELETIQKGAQDERQQ